VRRAALALLVAALAGCGGQRASGTATLWITRDEGRTVILSASVPAGETALQALERKAKVDTSYGGRFVTSVNGIAGSASGRRDWFYYVNGIEADRGAADYTLRPGDVAWWDLRSWDLRHPDVSIVVGAFPEPFLHGYDGRVRPTVVRYDDPAAAPTARALGRLVRAGSVGPTGVAVPAGADLLHVEGHGPCVTDACRHFFAASNGGDAQGPATFAVFAGGAERLVRDPTLARRRYGGLR
jgi:hypothetical protein